MSDTVTEGVQEAGPEAAALSELSTQPEAVPDTPRNRPGLRLAALRGWRQLTSMRTALLLLALLALAAIPGGFIPQTDVDPSGVTSYQTAHPHLASIAQKIGLFNVFESPWFAAIYLLLFLSLIGCLIPRIRLHAKALRRRPPKAPRRLGALSTSREWTTSETPAEAVERTAASLRRKHWRVVVDTEADGVLSVAAEKGYLRETGNLIFHVALLLMLVGVATSGLVGYKGQVLVNSGAGFSDSAESYSSFTPPRTGADSLPPFSFDLSHFQATYSANGEPASFNANINYCSATCANPNLTGLPYDIRVNHPLHVDGDNVYLINDGYAVDLTVRDPDGKIANQTPATFLSNSGTTNLAVSHGVDKAPDIDANAYNGLGLTGELYSDFNRITLQSDSSALLNPRLFLVAYRGNLGLNTGVPQDDFTLNTAVLKQLNGRPHELAEGQTWTLPNGDTVTFTGVTPYAVFQVAHDPGAYPVLIAAILILIGIILSLRIRRRRMWLRASPGEPGDGPRRTVISAAGLTRSDPEAGVEEFGVLTSVWISEGPDPAAAEPVLQEAKKS